MTRMALPLRQKVTMAMLGLYWPALFIFAHIPVPMWVRKAGVSDKVLHFLAYLILVFLLWFAVCPSSRVSWRRATAWWVLLAIGLYGAADELLQGCAGRSCDIRDFGADVAGTLGGLLVFSLLTFWPAAVSVTAAAIFGLTNLTRTSLPELLPITSAVFHLLAHGVFALLWVQNMRVSLSPRPTWSRWLLTALVPPIALLTVVKLFSAARGRDFPFIDVVCALLGIVIAIGAAILAGLVRGSKAGASDAPVSRRSGLPEGPV